MSEFSETFSRLIEERSIKVYDLIRFLDIDRSSMYQIIKGKRNPPTDEMLKKISDFLCLSPSEKEELFRQAQITRLGKNLYYQRKGVERFLKEFPEDLSLLWKDDAGLWTDDASLWSAKEETEPGSSQEDFFLPGEGDVSLGIQRIIRREIERGERHIALVVQPEENTLFHMLRSLGPKHSIRLEHILCLSNAEEMGSKQMPLYIQYLNTILPLYTRSNIAYDAYYYYDRVDSHFLHHNGFSGIILTSDTALLVTSDYSRGIVLRRPDIVRGLWEHFEKTRSACSPLFQISKVDMQNFSQVQASNDVVTDEVALYVMEREVCFLILVTRGVLEKNYGPGVPGREAIIEGLDQMLQGDRRKLDSGNWHMYFTKEGLEYFVQTGKFKELPDGVYTPLANKERIEMLGSLRKYCELGSYRMLTGMLEHLSGNLRLCVNGGIGYLILSGDDRHVVYMFLTEPHYLSIFSDYIANLDERQFYDNEETVRLIDRFCEELKESSE